MAVKNRVCGQVGCFVEARSLLGGFVLVFYNTFGLGDFVVLLLLWGLMVLKLSAHTAENWPTHVSVWFGWRQRVVLSNSWLWVCGYLCFMWEKQSFHGVGGVRPRQNAVLCSSQCEMAFLMQVDDGPYWQHGVCFVGRASCCICLSFRKGRIPVFRVEALI